MPDVQVNNGLVFPIPVPIQRALELVLIFSGDTVGGCEATTRSAISAQQVHCTQIEWQATISICASDTALWC
jgi:hypothetical protein